MVTQARRHRGRPSLPWPLGLTDSQRPHRPAEVVAVADEVGGRTVYRQVLREPVGLATLPRVLGPIRPVVPLHERGVNGQMPPPTYHCDGQAMASDTTSLSLSEFTPRQTMIY